MTKKEIFEINEQFKKLLKIDLLGYQAIEYDDSSTTISRLINDLNHRLTYDFYLTRDKSLKIGGLSYGFFSSEINDILFKVYEHLKTINVKDSPINQKFEYTLIHRIEGEEWENSLKVFGGIQFVEKGIFNEDRFILVADMFKKHIETYIEPYFESYQSLQDINDKIIEAVDESKWGDYFYGETNFRVTIIMKLCKNPRYDSFTKMVHDRIYNAIYSQGLTEYQDYYKMYNVLLEHLSKL